MSEKNLEAVSIQETANTFSPELNIWKKGLKMRDDSAHKQLCFLIEKVFMNNISKVWMSLIKLIEKELFRQKASVKLNVVNFCHSDWAESCE